MGRELIMNYFEHINDIINNYWTPLSLESKFVQIHVTSHVSVADMCNPS